MSAKALPDALLQELRCLLALHARDILMESKADGEKTDGQMAVMEKVYHGSNGFASVLDAMMEAKGFYGHLFQKIPLEVNRQGNEHRTNGSMLELLPIFHLQEGEVFINSSSLLVAFVIANTFIIIL